MTWDPAAARTDLFGVSDALDAEQHRRTPWLSDDSEGLPINTGPVFITVDLVVTDYETLPEQCGRHGVGFIAITEPTPYSLCRYVGTRQQLLAFVQDVYGYTPDEATALLDTNEVILNPQAPRYV